MNANNDNNKKQMNFGGSHYGFFFFFFFGKFFVWNPKTKNKNWKINNTTIPIKKNEVFNFLLGFRNFLHFFFLFSSRI
jgi:hypothetical protein